MTQTNNAVLEMQQKAEAIMKLQKEQEMAQPKPRYDEEQLKMLLFGEEILVLHSVFDRGIKLWINGEYKVDETCQQNFYKVESVKEMHDRKTGKTRRVRSGKYHEVYYNGLKQAGCTCEYFALYGARFTCKHIVCIAMFINQGVRVKATLLR